MSKKRSSGVPKITLKSRARQRIVKPPAAECYLSLTLRGLGDKAWSGSLDDFANLSAQVEGSFDEWEESAVVFFTFQTRDGSTVCVNTEYIQFARALEAPPGNLSEPLPAERMRIWLDSDREPRLIGAARSESLDFVTVFEVASYDQCLTWEDEQALPVLVRIGDIVLLEYPAHWGSTADADDIPF